MSLKIIDYNRHIFPWFQETLQKRLKAGFNNILLFCGEAGIGKSYAALTLCSALDPTFNIERVTFSAREFISITNKMKKHQWVIIDEPAISGLLGKRTWYQQVQQALVDQLETFRFKQLGVCLCAINANLLDKTVRHYLIHFMIWMQDRGYGLVYRYRASQFDSKVRTPFMGEVYFSPPPSELAQQYEEKRAKIQHSRYIRSLEEMELRETRRTNIRELLQRALEIKDKLLDENGKISKAKIMLELGVGRPRAEAIKKLLEAHTHPFV